ncbi:MAG: hypothetical protein ACEPOZ_09395 [Marinifilaceae bacterium]
MHKLKRIYNNLNSFDKSFLELYYQLKFSKKSQRWDLFQLLKRKEKEVGKKEPDSESDENLALAKNKGAYSQLKRRLRFDVESILLFRILSGAKEGLLSNRFLCNRFLLLADYYLENNMIEESQKKLKQALKIIQRKGLLYERLVYNELYHRLIRLSNESCRNGFLEDALSTLKAIELRLLSETELNGFRNSNSIDGETQDAALKMVETENLTWQEKNIVAIRKRMLKEWEKRNYSKAGELAEAQYLSLKDEGTRWDEFRLESLLHMAILNVFSGALDRNPIIFDVIRKEFDLSKKYEKEFFQVQFMTHFLKNDLAKCKALIEQSRVELNNESRENSTLVFFNALLLYKEGKSQKLSRLLSKETVLFSLPNNVGLNARILELYALMACGSKKLCSYKLESFRQAVMRSKTLVTPRYLFVERLLHCFLSNGMDATVVWEKYSKAKLKYGEDDERFRQDVEGFELISIEEFISGFAMEHLTKSKEEEIAG